MITAKDELRHLVDTLTPEQAEDVLELLKSVPKLAANVQDVCDDWNLGHWHYLNDKLTSVVASLLPCSTLFPKEEK